MWFKRNKNKPVVPVARPLTIQRVCALFDAKGWTYQFDEESLTLETGFQGFPLNIITAEDGLHVLATRSSDNLSADRFPEVLAWAEDFNNNRAFPTAMVFQVEDNMVHVGANFAIPDAWEYTDEQLDEWLECGISGIVDISEAFYATFDPLSKEEA